MPDARPSTTLFEDAIDVPLWLEADRETPFVQRSQRDRAIAERLRNGDGVLRVRGWWRHIDDAAAHPAGMQLARTRRLLSTLMVCVGAIFGVGVALTAFHYDGTRPVNVVTVLAALVVLPSVLLLLTLLLIPGRIGGLRAIQNTLAAINPGALAAALFRRLARPSQTLAPLFGWHQGRSAAARRFGKWQVLYWSQAAAVAFFVGAIATAIVLVTFTDLAFGWSTTLAADPATIERLVRAIVWPWAAWFPDAVPNLTLIERSQFFRLDGGRALAGASRELAGWWPFTILAIVTYGALPRLVMLALCTARLRSATRTLLLDDPRVTALLDRMAAPAIETAADSPERPFLPSPVGNTARHGTLVGTAHAVIWSASIERNAVEEYARRVLGLTVGRIVDAGGGRTLSEDAAALEELRGDDGASVIVFTRAWEPPLLEFADFIRSLRARVGSRASIVVAPVAESASGVDAVQRETWSRAIARLADPRLYLETGAA